MDKNKAKEFSNLLLAYSEGKTIEVRIYPDKGPLRWELADIDKLNPVYMYRIKSEPKLVPFTFEDKDLFKNKWFKLKTTSGLFKASYIDKSLIAIGASQNSYSELMQLFEFEDGSPCGKYINE